MLESFKGYQVKKYSKGLQDLAGEQKTGSLVLRAEYSKCCG
ncbi:MAG: hypothetical protein PV340_03510 [Wolbachia sp.]|nr:hypothetical protein [Wolbachia sp.]MDD9336730.1 hypothetical protein [Wolbachia sp.]